MKLVVKCKECRAENNSPNKGATRINIVQKFGKDFEMKCTSCNRTHTYEVDEIRAMDKSTLTRVERKELRKELRTINTELKSTGNSIYLSIGAIIIIILLLILIL